MRTKTWNDEQFINAVKNNTSIAGTLRSLNLKITGANYKTVKTNVKRLNLDTTHWSGCGHLKGKNHNWSKKQNLSDILVQDSNFISTHHLKWRLINEGVLTYKCDVCGITEWNNKQIILQLDHINGNNTDNRIENLKLLCPNCHSQTPTFSGKNKTIQRIIPKKLCQCGKILKDTRRSQCLDCYNKIRQSAKKL